MKFRRSSFRTALLLTILGIVGVALNGLDILVRSSEAQDRVNAGPTAAFTPGNIVVYRVGDGVASLNSNAAAVFLDEYTPLGSLVQTIAMPTAVSGANKRLTASGTAQSEGFLTLSQNGQYLLVPGYDAATATGSITTSSWSAINRVIGRVDTSGTVDTTTSLADSISGQNPRSAVSTDGSSIWVTTATAGIRHTTFSSTTSTPVASSPSSLRVASISGGQLYVSAAAGGITLATVGSGIPSGSGETISNLPGFPTTGAPYGYFFADLSSSIAGLDTVYVADESTQVQKYSLVSGNWVANGTIALTAPRGLTGIVNGASVTLFVTAGTSSTTLRTLTDTSGYNNTINGTLSILATSAASTAFRGVAMTPGTGSDTTPPDTNITGGPTGSVSSTTATFTYTSTEAGSTFQCALDGGAFAACPPNYTGLSQGSHTFQVRATDAAGNTDPSPASRTWTVDTVEPDTNITGGPTGSVSSTTATFTYTSTEAGSTFQCALDGGAFAACPPNYTGLSQGSHTFQVRATDAAGNTDPSPASRTWTVDTVEPDTNITGGPTGSVSSTTAAFTYTSNESGATFECAIDGGSFGACPPSYTGLSQGSHTFQVRATDAAGNTDPSPASRTWTVDTVEPDTNITGGPTGSVSSTTAAFTYTSNESGVTFECAIDGGSFGACPPSYSGLSQGSHTFQVRATDAAGNTDPSPASRVWTVDTVEPDTSIDSGPTGSVSSTSAAFTFSSNEASTTFECSLDGAPFSSCSSPANYSSLTTGPHNFQVRATDAASNVDASPASRAWTITGATSFNGALSVGAGEAFTSLTNNGGLFEAMNAGTFTGNVTVNITSDMTAETGTHALNQQNETGVGGYTIFFQASGGPRVISGTNGDALIRLNGADRVTFSGLAFGPYGITFRNAGNGATIRLLNDASNNSILNCAVEGGTTNSAIGVVHISTGNVTGNDNNSITDSIIRDRTDAVAIPVILIHSSSTGVAPFNSGNIVSGNILTNFTGAGVSFTSTENTTISNNVLSQTSARASGLFPFLLVGNSGMSITGNVIRDQSTTAGFTGFFIQAHTGTTTIERNRIYNIDNSTGSTSVFVGLQALGSDPADTINMSNNMFSIMPGTAANQFVLGVNDNRQAGTLSMEHNSILVGGTASGSNNSWAFRRTDGATTNISLVANLLFNARTGGGAEHFAAGDASAGSGTWSSNSNLYVGTGTTPTSFFDLGTANLGTAVDFAAWQAGPPARDASGISSVSNVGPFNVGNMFSSPNDLHLRTIGNNPAINAAGASGVTIDIDGQTRPFNGVPDIGADEVQTVPTAAEAMIAGRVLTPEGRGVKNVQVVVTGGDLNAPKIALSNAFGFFTFDGLRAGEVYVVSVSGKRFLFETPARMISLGEDALDVDFVAIPR